MKRFIFVFIALSLMLTGCLILPDSTVTFENPADEYVIVSSKYLNGGSPFRIEAHSRAKVSLSCFSGNSVAIRLDGPHYGGSSMTLRNIGYGHGKTYELTPLYAEFIIENDSDKSFDNIYIGNTKGEKEFLFLSAGGKYYKKNSMNELVSIQSSDAVLKRNNKGYIFADSSMLSYQCKLYGISNGITYQVQDFSRFRAGKTITMGTKYLK